MAEIDVRPTRDGELVLSHDPHQGDTVLVDHDWSDLADLDLGAGHSLGRLDELVTAAGDFPLNIEIKNWPADPDFDATYAFALAAAALARPIDLITCFHWPTVHTVRDAFPDIPTGLLVDVGWDLDGALAEARRRGHVAVAPHHTLISENPAAVMAAASGLDINVWTVNDPDLGIRLADAGVTGVITDDPAAMVAALQGDDE